MEAWSRRCISKCRCQHIIPPLPPALACSALPVQLKDYEGHGGLVVNWEVFGSGGLQLRPKGNPMMSYWRCSPRAHPGALRCMPGGCGGQGEAAAVARACKRGRTRGCGDVGLCRHGIGWRSRAPCPAQPLLVSWAGRAAADATIPPPCPHPGPTLPCPHPTPCREHSREEHSAASLCIRVLH
jgi:hypothetical protein